MTETAKDAANHSEIIHTRQLTCAWVLREYLDHDRWETECDQAFQFTNGGPEENQFTWCPYCGGRLLWSKSSDLMDDEEES